MKSLPDTFCALNGILQKLHWRLASHEGGRLFLAFAAGAHACVGMGVARLEAEVALLRTLQKLPGLCLRGEGQRGARARFRGFVSLPAGIA